MQLIDASKIFHKLRKKLGEKSNELTADDMETIYGLYQNFVETKQSKIFDTTEFGYRQVTVTWTEALQDETGDPILDDKGGPILTKEKDTEQIPLGEDVDEYFKREVLPHIPNAIMDRKKDKIGYEIPFNRYFYEYVPPRSLESIDDDLQAVAKDIISLLNEVTE